MRMRGMALSLALFAGMTTAAYAADKIEGRTSDPSSAAPGDPLFLIYVIPGVRDDGGNGDKGTATIIPCSNVTGSPQAIRVRVWQWNGAALGTVNLNVDPATTWTFSTHATLAFNDDYLINPPNTPVFQGLAAVYATDRNIFCSAMVVDASSAVPAGIALHMVRKNPSAVSQE